MYDGHGAIVRFGGVVAAISILCMVKSRVAQMGSSAAKAQ